MSRPDLVPELRWMPSPHSGPQQGPLVYECPRDDCQGIVRTRVAGPVCEGVARVHSPTYMDQIPDQDQEVTDGLVVNGRVRQAAS